MHIPRYQSNLLTAHVIAGSIEYGETSGDIRVRDGDGSGEVNTVVQRPHAALVFAVVASGLESSEFIYDVIIDRVQDAPADPNDVRIELHKYGFVIGLLSQGLLGGHVVRFYPAAEEENLIKGRRNPSRKSAPSYGDPTGLDYAMNGDGQGRL